MGILRDLSWRVVLDRPVNISEVQASTGDVSCEKDGGLLSNSGNFDKLSKRMLALTVRNTTMKLVEVALLTQEPSSPRLCVVFRNAVIRKN
jgi:hypothetical protein